MELRSFHLHELDPETRDLVGSLSEGKAVGAWIAREKIDDRIGVHVMPIGAMELLDNNEYRSEIETIAQQELDWLKEGS